MITFIKKILRDILPPSTYAGGLLLMLYTIFKDVRAGVLLLVVMIPQPNLWYKLQKYPFGKDFLDLLFVACVLGVILQGKRSGRLPNSLLLVLFIAVNYGALVNTSLTFGLPFPISADNWLLYDWKNYAQMILLYFLVAKTVETEREAQFLVLAMTVVVALVGYRAYKNFYSGDAFNYDKRAGGPFEMVGLGPNHLGAFMAYTTAMLGGLALCERDMRKRVLYGIAIVCGTLALLFSYSRGAYLAVVAVLAYYGLRKKPLLLVLCLGLGLTWQTVLPPSVVDRIKMTKNQDGEIENSAAHRMDLWAYAIDQFKANPVFGVGFGGFGMTVPKGELTDTHNVYVKMLSEQGIIGLAFLLVVLLQMFRSGGALMKENPTGFLEGLGLGLTGSVVAGLVANLFGDRWSYFTLGGYLWVWWGLVDRMTLVARRRGQDAASQLSG